MMMIQRLEEVGMNSWPAFQTLLYDGWVIRLAGGITRRANSISPLYRHVIPLEEKIGYCEQLYRSHGLRPVFKMTGRVFPENLDPVLEERGYVREAETSVQTLILTDLLFTKAPGELKIELKEEDDPEWMRHVAQSDCIPPGELDGMSKLMKLIPVPKATVILHLEGAGPVGYGLGVNDGTWLGLYNINVKKEYRNRGYGRHILDAILVWGKSRGAGSAYLGVMTDNPPALALYKKKGFQEQYLYWYRTTKK